jgi:chemotaxis protein CheZ
MANDGSVKEFAAERYLKRRQRELAEVSNIDLLCAIDTLRSEVKALRRNQKEPSGTRGADAPVADDEHLRVEIAHMVRAIGRAKAEISSISHPMADDDDQIKVASDELDEIVMATENATQRILESSEKVELLLRDVANTHHDDPDTITTTDRMANEIVTILEACSFQDITGQRITKVVKTLRFIQARLMAMIDIWGVEAFAELPMPSEASEDHQNDLENGPQLTGQGLSQADIDALMF